jgi:hypothetical protein
MRAVELFVAMQTGRTIHIAEAMGQKYTLRINGMIAEDGSGACWIVLAHDTDFNEQIKFFVRTTDNGGACVFRYMPKTQVYKY